MIKYKNTIFPDFFIDPITAIITNSKGEIQKIGIHKDGRAYFKGHGLHEWQAHTYLEYKKGFDIHHIDENKLNNSLSNLVYLTKSEHNIIHKKGKTLSEETKLKIGKASKGRRHSEEWKKKLSAARKGKKHPLFGTKFKWINDGIQNRRCPLDESIPEGFVRGMLKNINRIKIKKSL